MKIVSLLAVLFSPLMMTAQWAALPSGTSEHLHKIAFKDASVGYCVGGGDTYGYPVAGARGIVLRTANGGATWNAMVQDSTMAFSELAVFGDTVIAYGRTQMDAVVARSADNGLTWTVSTSADFVQDVKAFDGAVYFSDGLNLQRRAGASTSAVCTTPPVYGVNASGIYVLGGTVSGYFVAGSPDLGATWDTSYITPNPFSPSPFTDAAVATFGDTIIVCATYPGTLAYSYNNGTTWGARTGLPYRCFISSPRVVTGIGGIKTIVRTTDGGQTFIEQDTLPYAIRQFYFLNESLGYVCGLNGMIYKTTNGGGSATGISPADIGETSIRLYPNPASASLTVFGPVERGSLSVFNGAGQEVLTTSIAGQSTTITVGSLPPGVYKIVVAEKRGRRVGTKQWVKQ